MNYSMWFNVGGLVKLLYLLFKVNSVGVMLIIFVFFLFALFATFTRFTDNGVVFGVVWFFSFGGGVGYVLVNVVMICFFNYFYIFF